MRAPLRGSVWVLAALSLLAACGGGGDGGTTATPPPPATASGLDFTIAPRVANGTTVEFRWSGTGATGYRLDIGSTSGASDVASLDAEGAAVTWTNVPIGTFYARVRGRSAAGLGIPSNEVVVGSIDARLVIDALVFGFGPLAVAGNAAGPFVQDRMDGWQPGATFEVILGESVPAASAAAAEKTVPQLGPATRGQVQARLGGRRPDPLPPPRPGEVMISYVSATEVQDECSCDRCVGCAVTYFQGSFIQRSRILLSTQAQAATTAHELGHAIGLGHIISAAGVRPPFTMGVTTDGQFSPGGRLDRLEPATIAMLETVYGAGFSAGATRRQFEAAGLVLPEGQLSARRQSPAPPKGSVSLEGLETVVRRPVCQE